MVRRPPSLASGSSTPPLLAVPEDSTDHDAWKVPPSFQSRSLSDRESKGKARAPTSASTTAGMQIGEWVVDTVAAKEGVDKWRTKERVILILGNPSADSLSPLLYDETYSDTLLLVGTPTPVPSLEALLSTPASLPFVIQPTIKLFGPSLPVAEGTSPIPALLEEAQNIAKAYRRGGRRSRGMSSSTTSLNGVMSESPSMGLKRFSFFDTGSTSSLPRTPSDVSIPSLPSRSRFSTMSFGKAASDDESRRPNLASSGSVFDAIINFLQPPSPSQNGIRELLHQTMVLTAGVWPLILARSLGTTSEDLAIQLLHVLPSRIVGPIPNIIEDYLLSYKAGVAGRSGPREIRATVVHSSVWITPQVELYDGLIRPVRSGADLLLLDAVRPVGNRALVSRWKFCVDVLSAGSRQQDQPSTARSLEPPPLAARRSSPLVPARARLPSLEPANSGRVSPGYTNQQLEGIPNTPELGPTSMSSCSSASGHAEPTEPTTAGSTEGDSGLRVVNLDQGEETTSDSGASIGKKLGKAWKRVLGLKGRD